MGPPKTILCVDDDRPILMLYAQELREEGYDVILADNARTALDLQKEKRPDLVVLDIRMPGMDGLEALSWILDEEEKPAVVINTAYSSHRDNFMSWSADAYLLKSSDLTPLKNTIKNLIGCAHPQGTSGEVLSCVNAK